MIIDSHIHLWDFDEQRDAWITADMSILRRNYLPAELSELLKENTVEGCVAVQAGQSEAETKFLVKQAEENDFIKGVVGWIDLQSDHLPERLEYFSRFPIIKGWRHIVQAEPAGFLLKKKFQKGIAALAGYGYTYDILIHQQQLKEALEFVSTFPLQKFVIDHCAKPDIKNSDIKQWKSDIEAMAAHPNTCCKLSGLLTEADWNVWKAEDFYPYLDVVFGAFGANRLLFGSDWPVLLLSGGYGQWKSLLEKYMENHSAEETQKVFGLNATRFYNL
jgi:L-fuconolactonase